LRKDGYKDTERVRVQSICGKGGGIGEWSRGGAVRWRREVREEWDLGEERVLW